MMFVVILLIGCKNYYELPDGSDRPKKYILLYSKLRNQYNNRLDIPIVFLNVENMYFDSNLKKYKRINKDERYNSYLILLSNGRCFENSVLKKDNVEDNITSGKLVSVGYYKIDGDNFEVEIFGNTSGGFFGYETGSIRKDTLILNSKSPTYISKYVKTDVIIKETEINTDW